LPGAQRRRIASKEQISCSLPHCPARSAGVLLLTTGSQVRILLGDPIRFSNFALQ
jgi:hypothetical protein